MTYSYIVEVFINFVSLLLNGYIAYLMIKFCSPQEKIQSKKVLYMLRRNTEARKKIIDDQQLYDYLSDESFEMNPNLIRTATIMAQFVNINASIKDELRWTISEPEIRKTNSYINDWCICL